MGDAGGEDAVEEASGSRARDIGVGKRRVVGWALAAQLDVGVAVDEFIGGRLFVGVVVFWAKTEP